jgi:hypothetical protein
LTSWSQQSSLSSRSTPLTSYILDDHDTYPNRSDDDPTNTIEHGSYVELKLVPMALRAGYQVSTGIAADFPLTEPHTR